MNVVAKPSDVKSIDTCLRCTWGKLDAEIWQKDFNADKPRLGFESPGPIDKLSNEDSGLRGPEA